MGLLRAVAHLLQSQPDAPTREWLQRRAAPMLATLQLTELSTVALLQQYRIQPIGPKRAAPLVALTLRLDDREAAEVLAAGPPKELADDATEADGVEQGLAVDGQAALEGLGRKLAPLLS